MMYEDAKISKRNIYTAYSDFKGAFGGIDHRIPFQFMEEYGFQDSYIAACKQIYSASNIFGGRLPSGTETGEGGYHGETYGTV